MRKQYDTNTSLCGGNTEWRHQSFDEVETPPEVSSAVSIDTAGAVNQQSQVETFAADYNNSKQKIINTKVSHFYSKELDAVKRTSLGRIVDHAL